MKSPGPRQHDAVKLAILGSEVEDGLGNHIKTELIAAITGGKFVEFDALAGPPVVLEYAQEVSQPAADVENRSRSVEIGGDLAIFPHSEDISPVFNGRDEFQAVMLLCSLLVVGIVQGGFPDSRRDIHQAAAAASNMAEPRNGEFRKNGCGLAVVALHILEQVGFGRAAFVKEFREALVEQRVDLVEIRVGLLRVDPVILRGHIPSAPAFICLIRTSERPHPSS